MTTKEERDRDYVNSEIGNTFNTYKIVGAKLLQDGLITPDEYHQKVKQYGEFVGVINPDDPDIPDSIDDTEGLRTAMEIGGAIVGALKFGGSVTNPFGFAGYVLSQSLASGAGAASEKRNLQLWQKNVFTTSNDRRTIKRLSRTRS